MNIFILDKDIDLCAKYYIDKHVVKMPLETAQLLSTAVNLNYKDAKGLYRSTHVNHPCSVWTRSSRRNFMWLAKLGLEICEEYTRRYERVHASSKVIINAIDYANYIPDGDLTEFVQAMPDKYKKPDAVEAYRGYYIGEKHSIASWKTDKPSWWG